MIPWAEWGQAPFARARAESKPLLLSLTASWCHACHRMEEETWEDPGVAAVVLRATVPVRADADERPDVYARYHAGGLPSTALLTAEGEFVRGGTFLPPPQFVAFLQTALADFSAGRRPEARVRPDHPPAARLVDAVVARLVRRADLGHGGFGEGPKLPDPTALSLLLRRWRGSGEEALERIVRLTLDAIATHLGDPLEGGFFRYAAGADWSGPHTEKVAVDQAALIACFLEAASALGEPRYVEVARRALAHARRRLADAEGRILASVAAAGDYYAPGAGGDRQEPPPVDRRRFADAAAAMVSAGLLALALTGEDPGFQREFMARAASGCIPHRLDAPGGPRGLLRDQALGLRAAVDAYRLEGDAEALRWAGRLAEWSIRSLWDDGARAFRAEPAAPVGEVALPPLVPVMANGEMALGLAELADHLEGSGLEGGEAAPGRLRDLARQVVEGLSARAVTSPAGPALALAAQRIEAEPPRADLVGSPGDPRARSLARAVLSALGPEAVVRWTAGSPASVTLCTSALCLPALDDPGEIRQALADLGLPRGGILGGSPGPAV